MARKTIVENCDVLVVGGGMAGTGATWLPTSWESSRDGNTISLHPHRPLQPHPPPHSLRL